MYSCSYLCKYFDIDYGSKSGLVWKVHRKGSKGIKEGSPAGTLHHSGYYRVKLNGKSYSVHRIIYVLHNKIEGIPEDFVCDHVDGNKINNHVSNLRLISFDDNARNAKLRKDNKTGVKGVYIRDIKGYTYVCAFYNDPEQKKKIQKFFRVKDNDTIDNILSIAMEWRITMIQKLKNCGYDYTDRHTGGNNE